MKRPLWSARELAAALGVPAVQAADVDGVSIDSRLLRSGDLFVALSGEADARYHGAGGGGRDGHDFVADAARRGASAALVVRETGATITEIVVPDTFAALWDLARHARRRFEGDVFAITGSSGKTTAKGMLAAALPGCHSAEGSFNNHIGVPLTLARLPADVHSAVFEIGMNSPGEIAPLARLVRPRVALVLNVLGVHLEGLGSLEAIRREKLSIAEGLAEDAVLVAPDTLDLKGLTFAGRIVTFGCGPTADLRLDEPDGTVQLPDGQTLPLRLAVDGPHRRLTATAVLACLFAAGRDPEKALGHLSGLAPPAGRGGTVEAGGVRIIDDSYNANPDSMRLALGGLRELQANRRFALLGDMLELGPEEAMLHREVARACLGLDGVFCVGQRMRHLFDALPSELRGGWWPDCDAFDPEVVSGTLMSGDALLVKASNRLFWKHGTVGQLAVTLAARRGL